MQRWLEGFRWCGGKLCYNSTMYDSCCGEEGFNSEKKSFCYFYHYSSYNFKCDLPKKCCGNEACFQDTEETCCPNKFNGAGFVCKTKTQKCCGEPCCEFEQEGCFKTCCTFGYTCDRKYYPKCVMTYDYRFFPIAIAVNCNGFFLNFLFIKEKFCSGKIKKVGILNECNYHNVFGNHTSEETL